MENNNNSTQRLIQTLLKQISDKDNQIEQLVKSNEIQGIRDKEKYKHYKNTILLALSLVSISLITNILLLIK